MNKEKNFKKFKLPKIEKIKLTKKKIAIFFAVVAGIAGALFGYNAIFGKEETDSINTATVTKGDLTVSIEGSGAIEAMEMYEITSLATGDILQSDFEEGQEVKKGDLLYVIDTKDIDNTIEKAKVSLEKQQLTHNQTLKEYAGLSVETPISGVITQCYVKAGDSVQNGTSIADIINNEYMMLEVPFNSADAANINVGDVANIVLENSFYETTGTVQYVSSGEIITDSGATVSNVKIKVKNPGSITTADKATAIVNNVACNSSGTFDYWQQKTIKAETSGDVVSVNYTTGDNVRIGNVIVNLESESADVTLKTSELSLSDSELSLQNTYDKLEDYNITSPIDGTVIEKTSKAGDTLDSDSNSTVMAVVADLSNLKFDIDVDELDIGKIEVGQSVEVTADSLEGKVFEGTIANISKIGTNSNGVAYYPVTVVMEYSEDLMIGMNVDAKIVIESKEDVLMIPASALNRGNRVLVEDKDGSKAANQDENSKKMPGMANVPDGYTYVTVEIGISNTDYVEITSGLEEGDTIIVPTETTTTTTQQMMPGMEGGIPGGQMPTGGAPTGRSTSGGGAPGGF
ncbi:efflux RND transporter periplasmic adaptor subunit [Sedimentibacter sp. B4]|uniref:efflux RND transporter periplasmic adaptor subunit n=1 Tax=Sedimentibacter sp. B4 TaxID=304766 RepID=UPI0003123C8A|nr:HlyD family efflux transporter periplasmic adaptor subunit [Sedimentibacter sp. B4]